MELSGLTEFELYAAIQVLEAKRDALQARGKRRVASLVKPAIERHRGELRERIAGMVARGEQMPRILQEVRSLA